MLALTAASPSLIDRILKQLTAKQAAALRYRIEHPGPVRIQDMEQAQQELAQLATNLVSRGNIQAEPSPRFAAAV
jgi:flagellar motor switch protein FliG